MSSRWKSELQKTVRGFTGRRVAVIGVGNPLRGDDGAGSLLARRLREKRGDVVFDGGSAPENYCERVGALMPDLVLVIDAARFGGRPGEVRVLHPGEIAGGALSTHNPSIRLLAAYIRQRCGCELLVLGIEPDSGGMGEELSAPVKEIMDELEECLLDLLC